MMYKISLKQSPPQKIEGGLGSTPANQISIARQLKPAMLGLDAVREGNENSSHRLLFSAAAWTGDSSNGEAKICFLA